MRYCLNLIRFIDDFRDKNKQILCIAVNSIHAGWTSNAIVLTNEFYTEIDSGIFNQS